jgi:hypothetical protein
MSPQWQSAFTLRTDTERLTSPNSESGAAPAMTVDDSASWMHSSDRRERAQTQLTTFLMTPSTAANNITASNPFDPQVSTSSQSRDPAVSNSVQDHAREELSTLLNRMPEDNLTPLIAGLRIQPSPTVPTSDLLGLATEWPSPAVPSSSIIASANTFDSFPAFGNSFADCQQFVPASPLAPTTDPSHVPSLASLTEPPSNALLLTDCTSLLPVLVINMPLIPAFQAPPIMFSDLCQLRMGSSRYSGPNRPPTSSRMLRPAQPLLPLWLGHARSSSWWFSTFFVLWCA